MARKAKHTLHKKRILTVWKGKPLGGKLIKQPNVYASLYSDRLKERLTEEGYEVPCISRIYPYPGHYVEPRDCQRDMLGFQLDNPRAYNLSEPRTGKSAPVVWEIDIDITYNGKRKFLILAPLMTLTDTWQTELSGIIPHVPTFYTTKGGTDKLRNHLKRIKRSKSPQIIVSNFDKFWRVLPELIEWAPDSLYLDEAADFNNPNSRRSKALLALMRSDNRPDKLRAITGTPVPNYPSDAWSIARLINPATPRHLGKFRELTMIKHPYIPHKYTPRPDADKILAEVMQPSIRFRSADVNDMPPHEPMWCESSLTEKQERMYREMRLHMITEENDRVITAGQAAARMGKLLQIASGVCLDATGKPLLIGAENKLKQTLELIEETPLSTVIMSTYTAVQLYIIVMLRRQGYKVGHINGKVKTKERQRLINEFQKGMLDILVMHPGPTRYGLKLNKASQMIWWGPTYSALSFEQGSARIMGPGTGATRYVKLFATKLEREIFEIVEERMGFQQTTMSMADRIKTVWSDLLDGKEL